MFSSVVAELARRFKSSIVVAELARLLVFYVGEGLCPLPPEADFQPVVGDVTPPLHFFLAFTFFALFTFSGRPSFSYD